ncbi:hypothetical protein LCGC14_0641450 [marine sediment metagenome]|uniref:Uncharacterized protein n=1 Tax=marine sediment metagenome TaxID=412755 RepID=A0A0F9QZ13_9ZZZZ|nr:hypothetical protein [archaeon]HEC36774.1 hypothetical protein [bacterium]
MFSNVKSYKNTTISSDKSQAQIMKLLREKDIQDTRFTNISYETAVRAGMKMHEDTCAIMLEFFKPITLSDGVGGTIPVRIIIPNIPADEKKKNQAYRIFYWYLKTKFEAIETGLIEFEQEFMPHIALGKSGGVGTVWNQFKNKILPRILKGEVSDISLLEAPKKKKDDNEN